MEGTIQFLGAAGTVTGSKHLVSAGGRRILLDCGLFQGLKQLRLRNWDAPPVDPSTIDAVVLSHAHLDHSGYLPRLVKHGFRGAIHCTAGTADLLGIVLQDSARLQQEDAARANRYGYSKHDPALPLYTVEDALKTLRHLTTHGISDLFQVGPGFSGVFHRAGHILGAAIVELRIGSPESTRLVFSGDLGRWDRPILRDPDLVEAADILLIESTYGDRIHAKDEHDELLRIITETAKRGGVLIVPAFAIGRTQELIWTIRKLEDEGRLTPIPVYVDSPMAISATDVYCRHSEDHDLDMVQLNDEKRCPLASHSYLQVQSTDESKALNRKDGPMIVIAGSGMVTGGRVLHHLKTRLPDPRNTVLLTGFQPDGTRGRALQQGAEHLKIHGGLVPVRARVETIDGLSAHADQNEIFRWLAGFKKAPKITHIVHGEPAAAKVLADLIDARLGWKTSVAQDGEIVSLQP